MFYTPLAGIYESGASVVMPDTMTAGLLRSVLDNGNDSAVWEPKAVIAWRRLIEQHYAASWFIADPALDNGINERVLLSQDQEQLIWQDIINADTSADLPAVSQRAGLARLAQSAWFLQHAWQVRAATDATDLSDDNRIFRRWAARYRERTDNLDATDVAQLLRHYSNHPPFVSEQHLPQAWISPEPAVVQCWQDSKRLCNAASARPTNTMKVHAYVDREQELLAAFQWAQAIREQDGAARIVVAVDALANDHAQVVDCLRAVGGTALTNQVFVAANESRLHYPLIRLARAVCLLDKVTPWDILSEFITHPALRGHSDEQHARAAFDLALRSHDRAALPLSLVNRSVAEQQALTQLAAILKPLQQLVSDARGRRRYGEWLAHIGRRLALVGFEDHSADAQIQQQLSWWTAACDRLHQLDAVAPPVSFDHACRRLFRMLDEGGVTLPPTAIDFYVTTPAQAAAIEPTHLWLAAAESSAFLPASQQTSFLPIAAQRAAAVPGCEPRADVERAQQLLHLLNAQAGEVHASFAAGDGETRFSPSPLIPALAEVATATATRFTPRAWRQPAAELECLNDWSVLNPAEGADISGGIGAITAYNACAFQGFARYLLRARELEEPLPGMSARVRGRALHDALAAIWQELGDQQRLHLLSGAERDALLQRMLETTLRPLADETPLERVLRATEQQRLQRLIKRWLECEDRLEPFTIVACERPEKVELGGFQFGVRIDRIDRLADGSVRVVDYKSGNAQASAWDTPQMDEPQLPFYALTLVDETVSAIAFARLLSDKLDWVTRGCDQKLSEQEWQQQCEQWRQDLLATLELIQRGEVVPQPKYGDQTCRICEHRMACRRDEYLQQIHGDNSDE